MPLYLFLVRPYDITYSAIVPHIYVSHQHKYNGPYLTYSGTPVWVLREETYHEFYDAQAIYRRRTEQAADAVDRHRHHPDRHRHRLRLALHLRAHRPFARVHVSESLYHVWTPISTLCQSHHTLCGQTQRRYAAGR